MQKLSACLALLALTSLASFGLVVDTPTRVQTQAAAKNQDAAFDTSLNSREILSARPPKYPKDAKKENIQGRVLVRVTISDAGDVVQAEVLRGNPVFAEEALKAARGYKFKPATHDQQMANSALLPIDFFFSKNLVPEDRDPSKNIVSTSDASVASYLPGKGYMTTGKLLRRINAAYPKQAKEQRIQGVVTLKVVIGKDGNIRILDIISGPPELRQAAIDAVSMWQYTPFRLNGSPVEIDASVRVDFKLW